MSNANNKPRIALFGVGSLGGDQSGEGIPVIADLFSRLSEQYDIVYYSFTRVRKDNIPTNIVVRQIIAMKFPWRLKYLILFFHALADHIQNRFTLLFSVSVYPSGLFSLVLGKLINRPVLVQLIASEATRIKDVSVQLVIPWRRFITKFVCKHADRLITVADYQRTLAVTSLPTTRHIDVLPLRINVNDFVYRKRKIEYPVHFIQVGFYGIVKDQDTMFKAFAKVATQIDCHLTVVGYGFDNVKVNAMLTELGVENKVTRVGFVPRAKLHEYYDRAHILLHTARFETGCAVIQEAMASGVAVCGTNVGILADLGNQYANIVEPQSTDELAAEILRLVHDQHRYDSITRTARDWIKQHDARYAYLNYLNFLDGISGRKK
ncbi:glycosyltransferase family 4 protein [Pseudochryseolinea flava]|uniref:Glycosyl transferase family 1 domain-containing protein n=1 Tax=Pseudochryseolinea flava TaxID=2059302 RepID=A0A364YA31_9BACT|nr:glycosyltransferase family 4 protein [Pseudochryseolinea flava]RAW02748.1 hypothetical protein DQQ10_01170 [Pseudochryseolinea flava]